jgi:drug/metabolite transporter (DMT)-like permease
MVYVHLSLATVLWGVWGFAEKEASLRASPWSVLWLYSLPYVVFAGVGLAVRRLWRAGSVDSGAVAWSVVAGGAAIAASLFLLFAMRSRSASTAVALTSAYPIVTLVLGVLNRSETFRPLHFLGLCLVAGGAFLLNLVD